ncbi:hypothetical protein SESBI_30577 [Sesbania bispinosa]|nr:hypothetical protein SESBI_30577 [Sesbania bispinosa]
MSSLGDPMDSPLPETAGNSICTTPVASGTTAMLPPRNNRSTTWDHFTVESGVEKKASLATAIQCSITFYIDT